MHLTTAPMGLGLTGVALFPGLAFDFALGYERPPLTGLLQDWGWYRPPLVAPPRPGGPAESGRGREPTVSAHPKPTSPDGASENIAARPTSM